VGRGRRGWEECLRWEVWERNNRRIIRMGRGEGERRVVRWWDGEKDKEGRLNRKGEKRMGRMVTWGKGGRERSGE
jgi:hypothetical protein